MPQLSVGTDLTWQIAAGEAAQAKHQYIEREHVLIGLCSLEKALTPGALKQGPDDQVTDALRAENDTVQKVLGDFKITAQSFRQILRQRIGKGNYNHTERVVHRGEACKIFFTRAVELAQAHGSSDTAAALHLLAAILENPGEQISAVLRGFGTDPVTMRERVLDALQRQRNADGNNRTTTPFLNRYGRDLVEEARQGKSSPVIGRREEMLQVIHILSRRTKNNVILIGEAGVGKTAIVAGLAQRIAADKDEVLRGKRIIELSLASLVAGTTYRGQFEERLLKVTEEARTHPEVILFLDEIHTLVGAGSASGSLDAANVLKPALAHGEFVCIGATTTVEYRKYIEKDAALERRFQPVLVREPSPEETREVLEGLTQT